MLKVVVISIVLTGIAVALLGVRIFFVKNGKFPSPHVRDNDALRNKGIDCHNNL